MITPRKANERGHAAHGWLDTYHTFSFADYYDPKWMGYRSLRVITTGEFQYMAAGTGVQHSEQNSSGTEAVHLLQVWIMPDEKGVKPRYAEKSMKDAATGAFHLITSKTGRDGSMAIHQDSDLWLAKLEANQSVTHTLGKGRYAWLHVAEGEIKFNG